VKASKVAELYPGFGVNKLAGPERVAAHCGITSAAVIRWVGKKRLPPRLHPVWIAQRPGDDGEDNLTPAWPIVQLDEIRDWHLGNLAQTGQFSRWPGLNPDSETAGEEAR